MDYIQAGVEALKTAYRVQEELFKQGEISGKNIIGELVEKGSGSDKSLRGDWESEEAVIEVLRARGLPVRVIAEEHGTIDIVSNPNFLAVLDGYDGSSALAANPGARGGTMLAIAKSLNPTYNEFVFGGLTERASGVVVYGAPRGDVYEFNMKNGKWNQLNPFQHQRRFGRNTRVHLDDPILWEEHAEGVTSGLDEIGELMHETFTTPLKEHAILSGQNSSAAMCLDLLYGEVDAIGGVIAKGVFEPPAEYPMIRELGGIMLGIDGTEIGDKRWSEYGRPLSPLIRANSRLMGMGIVKFLESLRNKPEKE